MAAQQMPPQVQRGAVPAGKKPRKRMEAADKDVLLGIALVITAATVVIFQYDLGVAKSFFPATKDLYKAGTIPYISLYALVITAMFSFTSRSWPFGLSVAVFFTYFFAAYYAIAIFSVDPTITAMNKVVEERFSAFLYTGFVKILPVAMIGIAAALMRKK